MTPLPLPPPNEGHISFAEVGMSIFIGAAAWLVRYLCSTDKHSCGFILRRTLTAGLTSLLVGMAVQGYFSSQGLAFAAAGACGYASPEAVDLLLATLKKHTGGRRG